MTAITFSRVRAAQWKMEILHAVTQVTAINQQINTLHLGEVQPGHLAVGQNSQYAGLGGASLTGTNAETRWWVSSKKSPACITQRGSRADVEACASRPKISLPQAQIARCDRHHILASARSCRVGRTKHACGLFFDSPRRGEATRGGGQRLAIYRERERARSR